MINDSMSVKTQAAEDFSKARSKAAISSLLYALSPGRGRLLALEEVRNLLRPRSEIYQGIKEVPIHLIVGSEGRYQDFNRAFLPKKSFLRSRWESIDRAHITDVNLPAIKLYEINGVYFVRDGNHRVSVSRTQGRYYIDAEVIKLDTEIPIKPGMSNTQLRNKVIQYEKEILLSKTDLKNIPEFQKITFSDTGRFEELYQHIQGHKYFLNTVKEDEIPFIDAALSWYNNVYKPIIYIINNENLLYRFPGRTASDLYLWIVKYWDELKIEFGENVPLEKAAIDYSSKYGVGLRKQAFNFIRSMLKIKHKINTNIYRS